MKLIVAVDKNWGIGYKGDLLFRYPEDMKKFVEVTKKCGIILMGRKTFESFNKPEGLPGRINWVLTKDIVSFKEKYPSDNVIAFATVSDVINAYLKIKEEKSGKEVVCVGGAQIYELFLPYCHEAVVTKINQVAPNCDTYFPENLDKSLYWRPYCISAIEELNNGVQLAFWHFVRRGITL